MTNGSTSEHRDFSNWLVGDKRLMVLIVGLVVVAGLSSLSVLPRMEDPVLAKRVAIIVTTLPGADAANIEALITGKLELRLREIKEIKEIRSQSRPGVSSITIELLDSVTKSDEIWSNVRGKIDDTIPELPQQASRPLFDDLEVRAFASILSVVWDSEREIDYGVLRRTARELQDRLQAVPGTETVDRFGDPGEEVLVQVDPLKIAALGLSADDVADQLASFDAKDAAGLLRTRKQDVALEIGNQFDQVSDVVQADIRSNDGRFVRLGQVAEVTVTTPQPLERLGRHGDRGAISLGILIRPEVRIDSWALKAAQVVNDFSATLPSGLTIVTVLDQSKYVANRLKSLAWNLALGGIAVCGVILLLMGWRSAIIVASALPLTLLTVLFLMRLLGIPIHQMSITGLIIALGLLIDNAIVIVDEVSKERAHRYSPLDSVSIAVRRLAVPLFGSTLTTAFAFAPIAIMPGPAGEFVGSIAMNVMLAIFTSLIFSLTIVAALAGLYVQVWALAGASNFGFLNVFGSGIHVPTLTTAYRRFLVAALRSPKISLGLSLALPMGGFIAASQLPEQFFPPADRDQFYIDVELPSGSSMNDTVATSLLVDQVLFDEPIVQTDWFFGESAPTFYYNLIANRRGTPNFGQAILRLKGAEDADELIPRLQFKLDRMVPEARVLVRQLEQGPPFDAPVEVRLFGPDLEVLAELGNQVRTTLTELPEVIHTRSLLVETLPKIRLSIDSQSARMAGFSPQEIAAQVQGNLDGRVAGAVIQDVEVIPVRVRIDNDSRTQLSSIRSLDLLGRHADKANTVPLRTVSRLTLEPEVGTIVRLNQRRMNEVSAYLAVGVLPSKALARLTEQLESTGFTLPPGYEMTFGGEASKRDDAVGNLLASVGVLFALMIATLVLSFGSFRMAAIIGSVGGLSIGLGMGALWLGAYPFGFMAIIGTMGLVGIAINDSIVVLASLVEHQGQSEVTAEKIATTVMASSRHVIATTLTTVAGFAPLIWAGGEFWPPLAVAIAGGVVGATALALIFVPCAFLLSRPVFRSQMANAQVDVSEKVAV